MRQFYIIIVGLAIVISSPANATIINIPNDYPTIQIGIDSSSNGDTVLVADGTYYEHINFSGKAILVKSENGAASTIIEKQVDYTPIVTFSGEADTMSILSGFTIKNATSTGIYCDSGSAKIEDNIIEYNTKDPDVDSQGGAITVKDCTFPVVIRNNIIRFNDGYEAGFNTGGIYADSASLLIIDSNSIYQNIGNLGGGIFTRYSCTKSKYNLIYKNHALGASGIYYQYRESGSLIINNTIVDNLSVIGLGASIYLNGGSEYTEVKNNIIAFNQDRCIKVINASDVHVSYNCVYGNDNNDIFGVTPEESNIYVDPLFVDRDNDDYSLLPDSPCINNGDPDSPLDPDGTRADMGALYFQLLAGYGDLSGVVQDIVGNPIPGASVNIDSLGLNYTTGPDGIYYFDDLDATWRYQLSVSHDSYIDTVLTNVWVFDDETTYVDIVLNAFSYISGVVTNPNTEPIEGVIVQIQGNTTNVDTTNTQGEYFIDWIINGAYDITFSHPQYIDTLVEDIEALPNDTTELDIILGYTGAIAGIVTNSSMEAISGVLVNLSGFADIIDTTDALGEYSLDYIDPGTYDVFFSHLMFIDDTVSNVEVITGDTTELNITLIGYGALAGVVTDNDITPSPINHVLVIVEGTNPLLSAYTNYNGVYEILDIPEGAYDISFSHGGYFDTTVSDVSFTRGDTTSLDMQMVPIPPLEYLPGDFNMYFGIWPPVVIGSDLTYGVNFFRGIGEQCKLDGFWASADANGDCNIIGSDVTRLLHVFRCGQPPLYCPDYPPAWPTSDDLPDEAPSGWPNCDPPAVNDTKIIPNGSFK